jgi:arginase family enzyme
VRGLTAVTKKGKVVGFDIVQLNPTHDVNGLTARTVNWIMFKFLRAIAECER